MNEPNQTVPNATGVSERARLNAKLTSTLGLCNILVQERGQACPESDLLGPCMGWPLGDASVGREIPAMWFASADDGDGLSGLAWNYLQAGAF